MVATDESKTRYPTLLVTRIVASGAMGGQIAGGLQSQRGPVHGTSPTGARTYPPIVRGLRRCEAQQLVNEAAGAIA